MRQESTHVTDHSDVESLESCSSRPLSPCQTCTAEMEGETGSAPMHLPSSIFQQSLAQFRSERILSCIGVFFGGDLTETCDLWKPSLLWRCQRRCEGIVPGFGWPVPDAPVPEAAARDVWQHSGGCLGCTRSVRTREVQQRCRESKNTSCAGDLQLLAVTRSFYQLLSSFFSTLFQLSVQVVRVRFRRNAGEDTCGYSAHDIKEPGASTLTRRTMDKAWQSTPLVLCVPQLTEPRGILKVRCSSSSEIAICNSPQRG